MIKQYFRVLLAPFISLSLVIIGHGLATTYTTMSMHRAGFSITVIGLISSCYYLGLVLGSFRVEHFVARIGHIRAYAAFLSIFITVTLLCSLWIEPISWGGLRLIYGICAAGFFVVIESWFLSVSTPKIRGQILSLYMISYYGAYSFGQYLLNLEGAIQASLFIVTAILGGLSIFPLATTKNRQPEVSPPEKVDLLKFISISPTSVIAAFTGGLFTSVVLSLMPLFITKHVGMTMVPHFMVMIILGGMLFQFPIGKLSDYVDRRKVVFWIYLITGVFSIYCFYYNPLKEKHAELMFILFGGLTSVMYPLGINMICDNVQASKIVMATQAMLMFYSLGCVLGPIIAPLFSTEQRLGLFLYMSVFSFSAMGLTGLRLFISKPVSVDDKIVHVPVPPVQTAAAPELIQMEALECDKNIKDPVLS